jgi:hypothetical protein
MPAETNTANHTGRCYSSRCYDNWRDYDWPIRATSSVGTTMKAKTTSLPSGGAVNIDE